MLTQDEWDYVIERLILFVGTYEKPRETLAAPFHGTALLADLISGTPAMIVRDIVRLCVADTWNHEPPWLVLLLDLMPIRDTDAKLFEIRNRVAVKPPPGPNRLDATVLDNGTPFVNRVALRRHLRRLSQASAATKPILVVNGAAQSGKSYSTQYIEHFSLVDTPPSTTYRMELKQGTELETGPEEVATELVSMMGRTLERKPQPNTNQKLYAQQLARWVLNEAVQTPTLKHWILLDNFQGEKLRPDTRDFVVALADTITNGVFPHRCRLVLIGFDRANLTVDPGKVDEERIAACQPTDIAGCVSEIAARAPVVLAPQPLVDFVMNGLPADAPRMRELNARLRGLLAAVDRITEIVKDIDDLRFEEVLHEMLEELPSGNALMPELQSRLDRLSESAADLRAS